jgi:Protein of unknown function (DUF3833)
MFFILGLIVTGALVMSFGFTRNNIHEYKGTTPRADIKEYFNGSIKAWGIVQDWRGRVVRRFDINMVGVWRDNVGTLTENFDYYDGQKQQRIWTIKKLENGQYEGTAADILDRAIGQAEGNAVWWNYVMDLPVGDVTYRLRFDDWMWVMNDDVLINRSYLKKFGFTVAELTIFMQKQK